MAGRRSKKAKVRKFLIQSIKWISAIIPVCAFIYILYYYKQFDFLKSKPEVVSKTEIVSQGDSLGIDSVSIEGSVRSKIKILKNEWHSVGGIAIHTLMIENASDKLVKGTEIEFKYLSDTQAILTSKIVTIKTPLPAGKSTQVPGVSVGYVNNSVVGCDTRIVRVRY
jgi:hypothetical protein